jgi:hypothetical protein
MKLKLWIRNDKKGKITEYTYHNVAINVSFPFDTLNTLSNDSGDIQKQLKNFP